MKGRFSLLLLALGLPTGLHAQAPLRTWTDTQGRTLTASIVDYDDVIDVVTVKKATGSTHALALQSLSEKDHAYIKAYRANGHEHPGEDDTEEPEDVSELLAVAKMKLGEMVKLEEHLPSYDVPTIKKYWANYHPPAGEKKTTAIWIVIYMEETQTVDQEWRDELLTFYLRGSTWVSEKDNASHVFRNSVRNLNAKERASGAWDKEWTIKDGIVHFPYNRRATFSNRYRTLSGTPKGTLKLTATGL